MDQLEQWVLEHGEKKFRAKQLYQWMHVKLADSVEQMSNLPAKLREQISENSTFTVLKQVTMQESAIDGTRKYLFGLPDGHIIESVLMKYKHGNSVCISSQVGCRMGCRFCASTLDGLERNLRPSEMLDQIYRIQTDLGERVSNVVVMGSGEPMDNYESVLRATEILTSDNGFAMSPKRITVSSVGVLPALRRFCNESRCNIAISLHSPFHEERMEMMPIEKAYPIASVVDMLKQCEEFRDCRGGLIRETSHQRRLSFEYILLKGKNDSRSHASAIVSMLRGLDCRVNIIPFHSYDGACYETPSAKESGEFCDYLNSRGLISTIRQSRGQDISAACGMLSSKLSNNA